MVKEKNALISIGELITENDFQQDIQVEFKRHQKYQAYMGCWKGFSSLKV